MSIKRIRMAVSDTGTFGDTGFLSGELLQLRWYPTTDTGHTLVVTIHPSEGDTGHGFQVWVSDSGEQKAQYIVAPRQKIAFTPHDGTNDTGWTTYVGAGDKISIKGTATGTGTTSGTFYIYYDSLE